LAKVTSVIAVLRRTNLTASLPRLKETNGSNSRRPYHSFRSRDGPASRRDRPRRMEGL
jgi:hypothetical protein